MKTINSVLADGLAALNAVLAILIVLAGAVGGSAGLQTRGYGQITGAIIGGATLALAVDIRSSLSAIRAALADKP